MKIHHSDMIRIARKDAVLKIVKTLKTGDKVAARIINRQGRYLATIDVRGRHLKAEFPGGVPGSNHLTLQLLKKEGDDILFKLIQATATAGLKEKVAELLPLPSPLLNTLTPAGLTAALGQAANLFELNIFLLNPDRKEKVRGEGITALLNRLAAAGAPQQSLLLVTSLLEGQLLSPGMFDYILGLLSQKEKKKEDPKTGINEEDLLALLNEESESSDNNTGTGRQLLVSLFDILGQKENPMHGEIPFPIEGEFIPLKVFRGEDAWFFSLELSSLGTVDIIARREGVVNVYVDSPEKLEEIKKNLDAAPEPGTGIIINFFLRQAAIDKLVAINTFYSFNSQLDIKV